MARRPRLIAPLFLRALVLAGVAAALLVVVAQLAHASDPPPVAQVTIQPAGGGAPRTLAFADLAAAHDVHGVGYTLRSADGSTRTVTVADGISLAALLRAANVDPAGFYVEVARPDGTPVFVLHDQVVSELEGQVVLWSDADGLHFLRPSTGSDDVNDGDTFVAPNGTLALGLRTGEPLGVRIDASALRGRPHQPISFRAVLLHGRDAAGVTFEWYFADGTPQAHDERVVHRFRSAGTYPVQVNVKQRGRALETHDVRLIHITAAPAKHHHHHAATGGQGGGAGDGGAGAGGGGAIPSGSTTGGGAPTTTPHPRSHKHRHAHHRPAPRAPQQPQGTLVSGTLLASASATPLPAAASARGGQDGTPSDSPLRIPAIAWVAAGLAAILALGWGLEARHTPPFWQP